MRRALAPAVAAKSFSIPALPAIRKYSPIPAIPGRSSASPIRTSATSAPISTTRNPTKPYIEALIVREFSELASNWRSSETAQQYLERHGVPVIWDIDTRALVRHLREVGALRGIVSTDDTPAEQLIAEARALPTMAGQELAGRVTTAKSYEWNKGSIDLAAPRCAMAATAAQASAAREEKAASAPAEEGGAEGHRYKSSPTISASSKIFCVCSWITAATSPSSRQELPPKTFLRSSRTAFFSRTVPAIPSRSLTPSKISANSLGRVPIFGICLGHQLCGLALGGKTFKLKFGHHGSNHPVKNLLTQKVEITSQNHGFCVDPESLPSSDVEITHVNLNDHTNEGMRHRSLPLFSVQYHPEASPGPHDARYLFDDFIAMMRGSRRDNLASPIPCRNAPTSRKF